MGLRGHTSCSRCQLAGILPDVFVSYFEHVVWPPLQAIGPQLHDIFPRISVRLTPLLTEGCNGGPAAAAAAPPPQRSYLVAEGAGEERGGGTSYFSDRYGLHKDYCGGSTNSDRKAVVVLDGGLASCLSEVSEALLRLPSPGTGGAHVTDPDLGQLRLGSTSCQSFPRPPSEHAGLLQQFQAAGWSPPGPLTTGKVMAAPGTTGCWGLTGNSWDSAAGLLGGGHVDMLGPESGMDIDMNLQRQRGGADPYPPAVPASDAGSLGSIPPLIDGGSCQMQLGEDLDPDPDLSGLVAPLSVNDSPDDLDGDDDDEGLPDLVEDPHPGGYPQQQLQGGNQQAICWSRTEWGDWPWEEAAAGDAWGMPDDMGSIEEQRQLLESFQQSRAKAAAAAPACESALPLGTKNDPDLPSDLNSDLSKGASREAAPIHACESAPPDLPTRNLSDPPLHHTEGVASFSMSAHSAWGCQFKFETAGDSSLPAPEPPLGRQGRDDGGLSPSLLPHSSWNQGAASGQLFRAPSSPVAQAQDQQLPATISSAMEGREPRVHGAKHGGVLELLRSHSLNDSAGGGAAAAAAAAAAGETTAARFDLSSSVGAALREGGDSPFDILPLQLPSLTGRLGEGSAATVQLPVSKAGGRGADLPVSRAAGPAPGYPVAFGSVRVVKLTGQPKVRKLTRVDRVYI